MPRVPPKTSALENAAAPVNHSIPLWRYLKSLDALQQQATQYRSRQNLAEEYRLLFRYASAVVETIPRHSSLKHPTQGPKLQRKVEEYKSYLRTTVMPRLEYLKEHVKHGQARRTVRKAHVIPVQTSNMPQIDWNNMQPAAGIQQHVPADYFVQNRTVERAYSQLNTAQPPPRPPGSGNDPFAASLSYACAPNETSLSPAQSSQTPQATALTVPGIPEWASSLTSRAGSQQINEKHLLFAPSGSTNVAARSAAAPQGPLYPTVQAFDVSLNLLDAAPAKPLTLPPQELPVTNQVVTEVPPPPSPGASCEHCATGSPHSHASSASAATTTVYKAKNELRDVYISPAVMNEFMHFAQRSTRAGIESCGILAGTLSADDSAFTVTTLIIPKQKGEANTVEMLNEEEIFDFQFERGLLPLGWIHTHPTQTCFLSSVDVHTQCGFQVMLAEAVAIVMAPTDPRSKTGIFRLTTPGGMGIVQECTMKGFHQHKRPSTGQEIYELCGHVFLDESAKYESIDLR